VNSLTYHTMKCNNIKLQTLNLIIMTEISTRRTERLILEDLPRALSGSSEERWSAVREMRARADELAKLGSIDEHAIREVAAYNAGKFGLDAQAADRVFDVVQKPGNGSMSAMHAPSGPMWLGTGGCVSAVGPEIVHYINCPGIVEAKYGHGLPYMLDKLAWLAIARDLKNHEQVAYGDGYSYVANRLNRIGRKGMKPHIGSFAVRRDDARTHDGAILKNMPEVILSSASGTLPTEYHDRQYNLIVPGAIERADADREAGLFDDWEPNKRAGLFDIVFAEMTARALFGETQNHQMASLFDIGSKFEGVDIN
jgi:hypothetical protein